MVQYAGLIMSITTLSKSGWVDNMSIWTCVGAVEYNDDPDAGGIVQTRRLNTISFDERGHLSSAVVSNSQTIKTKLNRLYGEDAMACIIDVCKFY